VASREAETLQKLYLQASPAPPDGGIGKGLNGEICVEILTVA
jgi:hypothetical protein